MLFVTTSSFTSVFLIFLDRALVDHWSCLQYVKETDRILDVGCGSGIQGLSLAVRSSGKAKVICVDINERALKITKLNFEWNNIDQPTLILGNINSPFGRIFESETTPKPWKNLLGESMTYLVSNPPFLPVPNNNNAISSRHGLFSSGGSTGEEFIQNLMQLAYTVLDREDPSAIVAIVSEFMNPGMDFDFRLSSWWNDVSPVQALLFSNEEALDAGVYARRRADSLDEVSIWEHHLQEEGIRTISPGLMFLKRKPTTCSIKPSKEIKNTIHDTNVVDLTHYLVPKTSEGSIWTPTNLGARDFTRYHIKKFQLL